MARLSFRQHHLLEMLFAYEQQHLPLDLFIKNYFKAHKSLGSKDRAEIAENIYGMIRWRGALDYLAGKGGWEEKFSAFQKFNAEQFFAQKSVPLHIRLSFPKNLFEAIVRSHGEEKAVKICLASNQPAPTTIRANLLKITRDELLNQLEHKYPVSPCQLSKAGIVFHKKLNFFELPEFKSGFFEVQDEGSQLVAGLIEPQSGQLVLDFCAGSGGKSLAFAPSMQGKGQIFLHDVRARALAEATKRLRRAGIQNAQVIGPDSPALKKLHKKMDWVLVDAPCTGTGTLRRNPDMKWKWEEETLRRLTGQQRTIFEKALSFVKPGGCIVYATCSILDEENKAQAAHFEKTYGLHSIGQPFESIPEVGGMDGFFGIAYRINK